MGSPADATHAMAVHSEDSPRDRAVVALSDAMAATAGIDGPPMGMIERAGLIVDATCNVAGRRFAVVVEGSEADARALATAVRSVVGEGDIRDGDVTQAAAAITALVTLLVER